MMEKLKACPHCGGKAVFERFNNPKNWYVVRCTVCGCQTDGFRINHDDATDAQNKSANAAVWNRRAEPESKALTAQWISAKDKLPEIGQRVVVKCNELYHGMFDVLCYYPDYKPWKNDGVAYWLPLPELPENTRKPEGSEKP